MASPSITVPPCTFEMDHYYVKKSNNTVWRSPKFYVFPNFHEIDGFVPENCDEKWTLQLKVYANGCEEAKGDYLSVCISILNGWSDNTEGVCTVELLEWGDNSNQGSIQKLICFMKEKPSYTYHREHLGIHDWGHCKFANHETVESSCNNYLQNGCLKFRVKKFDFVSKQKSKCSIS